MFYGIIVMKSSASFIDGEMAGTKPGNLLHVKHVLFPQVTAHPEKNI